MELVLGFIHAGHVLEGDLLLETREQLGPALSERHGLVAAGLHLPHEENPEQDEQEDREPADDVAQPAVLGGVLDGDVDLAFPEDLDQVVVLGWKDRLERPSLLVLAPEVVVRDGDLFDVAQFDLVHELGEIDFLLRGVGRLEEAPEEDDEDPRRNPEKRILQRSILSLGHGDFFLFHRHFSMFFR